MSVPSLEVLKYNFRYDVVEFAVMGDGCTEVRGDGTREDVPTEVVGGDLGLDGSSKVEEQARGTVYWIYVYDNNQVNGSIWVKPLFELMVAVDELNNLSSYGGLNLVRG